MLPNVTLNLMLSKKGKTLNSRDSVKKDAAEFVSRVQSVKFIEDYLISNPSAKLDIYYFNTRNLNISNIESVNKSPEQWAQFDSWVKSMAKYDSMHYNPSFDIAESIKTSRQVNCGCCFRFERNFIEKAIFFEITDADKQTSIWFLLPDNRVLLYIMDGNSVLGMTRSEFENKREYGLIYPCVLFERSGKRILQ